MRDGGKRVLKSVRMTEELYTYIDNYRGLGFSNRLENIVFDAMCSEQKRLDRIADLDDQIQDRLQLLRSLDSDIFLLRAFIAKLSSIDKEASALSCCLASLSDDMRARGRAGSPVTNRHTPVDG